MGCIGMSLEDFEQCTPSEFYAIYEQWKTKQEREHRDRWERARMIAAAAVQPHLTKVCTALELFPLSWDVESAADDAPDNDLCGEELTEYINRVKAARGLT